MNKVNIEKMSLLTNFPTYEHLNLPSAFVKEASASGV
jgi:hypothetical protein